MAVSHPPKTLRRCAALGLPALLGVVATGALAPTRSTSAAPAARTASAGSQIVGEAPLPDGSGLWIAHADGTVTPVGAAQSYGDLGGRALAAPIRAIASTADGHGYWLLGSDGGIFTFGDASFFGSTGAMHLNKPIVGMAPTADDRGYWLVASDGGIFSFGDAQFYGSTGAIRLSQPIVGMAPVPGGSGYWLVAADGGIFSYGTATFAGSTGAMRLASPMVGMASTGTGHGYWLVASDGGVFTFGDATWHGSAAGTLGPSTAVGIIPAGGGYWIPTTAGSVAAFDAPAPTVPAAALTATTPPTADPATSEAPPAGFASACYNESDSTACNSIALAAIDSARSGEGLPALDVPGNLSSLPVAQQLVLITNAERTSRGLPAFAGPDAGLDQLAQSAAAANADPHGPAGVSWASNWAGGTGTPLAADYLWMYDDGPGAGNIDCTASNSSGCWGHRHNVLVPWGGSMGAASMVVGGWVSMTELMAS